MAKNKSTGNKSTGKWNLKMRKRIRRTFGILFMVSAIVVAAIPVDPIEAARVDDLAPGADTRGNAAYPNIMNENPVPSGESRDDVDVDFGSGYPDLSQPEDPADIYTSYTLTKLSDATATNPAVWTRNWQYKYIIRMIGGTEGAIVVGYNDNFREGNVVMPISTSVDYYTVEEEDINDFFAPSNGTDPAGPGYIELKFTYADYVNLVDFGTRTPTIDFGETYAKEEWDTYLAACKARYDYLKAKAEWDQDMAAYDPDDPDETDPNPGPEPLEVTEPPVKVFNPANLREPYSLQYYCEWAETASGDAKMPGTGYTLVAVIDENSSGGGQAERIYFAQGGQPAGLNASNDKDGFLVTGSSSIIMGIGERAFMDIQNVDSLTMPAQLKYIGDEAFLGSFIDSINLQNVENIGNRAFKNCSDLRSLELVVTQKIGAESFYNSGITEVSFPNTINEIGTGAFAFCAKLTNITFSTDRTPCDIGPYAFYDCISLNGVTMEESGVQSIGEGAFALTEPPEGAWTDAVLPRWLVGNTAETKNLGNYLFEGRTNLLHVTMPAMYGTTQKITMQSGTFRGCSGLEWVKFPDNCGNVEYSNLLFLDVANPGFYVTGPEFNNSRVIALPRSSTWDAFTLVSDYVPYVYYDTNGLKCYEVSDGNYILQANETGELTSCTLVPKSTGSAPIDLVIPSTVGGIQIKKIASGCFSEEALRRRIRSITVSDDSLDAIDARVFSDLQNLEWAVIGDSVNSIGEGAFAGCGKLTDVTFHPPSAGYENFTIGKDAFLTGNDELTLHGDIKPGYAPFEFATGETSGLINEQGKRICYKSLEPSFMTVMYDAASNEVTLLEYPKFANLDEMHTDYMADQEAYYYNKYGMPLEWNEDDEVWIPTGSPSPSQSYQVDFLNEVKNSGLDQAYKSRFYGPWIDVTFANTVKALAGGEDPADTYPDSTIPYGTLVDPSLVTSDMLTLRPFYDQQPYSIEANYDRAIAGTDRGDFERVTPEELRWIDATVNIVVPAGVTSIDASGFIDAVENQYNLDYIERSVDFEMSTEDRGDDEIVPGLFSGYYVDYKDGSDYETVPKGNDRIESVTMSTVKSLPPYAFDNCEKLKRVVMGEALADISTAPFRGCPLLTEVTGNEYYAAEQGLILSVNTDGSYTIEECLMARGNLAPINNPVVSAVNDPLVAQVTAITDGAFEGCSSVTSVDLTAAEGLKIIPTDCFNDMSRLGTVRLPAAVNRIESNAFGDKEPIRVEIPGKEVHIATDAMRHTPTNIIVTYEDTSAEEYGLYHDITVEYMAGKFEVNFVDYDMVTQLAATQWVAANATAVPPLDEEIPVREGYKFTGWMPENYTNITKDTTFVAQYSPLSANENKFTVKFYDYNNNLIEPIQYIEQGGVAVEPLPPIVSGMDFVQWKPKTYLNVQDNLEIVAEYQFQSAPGTSGGNGSGNNGSPSPSASRSPSPSATSSPDNGDDVTKYTVSVSGGSGSGSYAAGSIVTIGATDMGTANDFDKWTTSSRGVSFLNPNSPTTTFTMPANNVVITATYKPAGSGGTGAAATGTGGGSTGATGTSTGTGTGSSGGTTVQVTNPGIPSGNVASASVNGSLDNFVIKITSTEEATAAAVEALQKQYGDISNIRYLPMDISLYDSTGRTKITDTAGITVDISIPLPSELIAYAGNNMTASTLGGTLEKLNARFSTVDGIPCINFTATHFSPYVIYVDTANLSVQMDDTPETGDLLHPKWFLVMGLGSISMLLFLKRDKRVPVKAAK